MSRGPQGLVASSRLGPIHIYIYICVPIHSAASWVGLSVALPAVLPFLPTAQIVVHFLYSLYDESVLYLHQRSVATPFLATRPLGKGPMSFLWRDCSIPAFPFLLTFRPFRARLPLSSIISARRWRVGGGHRGGATPLDGASVYCFSSLGARPLSAPPSFGSQKKSELESHRPPAHPYLLLPPCVNF